MANLPKIVLEKLERGEDYPTPYRAHIVGGDFDHHGEAESPELALLYAVTHWLTHGPKTERIHERVVDTCPECGKELQSAIGGGVKCSCGYWFCF